MNRHERRAAAASAPRQQNTRDVLATVMAALRGAPASASGATVVLPDGETLYVSRETAEAMAPPAPSHAEHLGAIHREAAGLMHLDVVRREDMPGLIAAAVIDGHSLASALLPRVNQALAEIVSAPSSTPKLCASCPRPLDNGEFTIVLATPACDDPSNALALAICDACATSRDTVRAKATQALRKIWPDCRHIRVTHPEGGSA